MKNAWIVVPLLLSSACADAQILPSGKPSTAGKSTDPLNRDLPQSSVVAFLEAAHAHNYAKAWRYLDLRKMPEEERLAPNRDRVATFHVNGQTLELDLERVTLHSGLSVWLFSSDSVARIPIVAQLTNNAVIEGICLFRW